MKKGDYHVYSRNRCWFVFFKSRYFGRRQEIIAQAVVEIGTGSSGPNGLLDEVFEKTNLKIEDMANIIATAMVASTSTVPKAKSVKLPAMPRVLFECPGTTTILDIGGQDVKSIKLNSQGLVMQFAMNDKCVAGTGRFLDVMSKVLKIPMSEMGDWYSNRSIRLPSAAPAPSLQNRKSFPCCRRTFLKKTSEAGVHQSIAKACALVRRVGVGNDLTMTGGGSRDPGVVDAVSKELGIPVRVALHPQGRWRLGSRSDCL